MTLINVPEVPKISKNLISVEELTSKGIECLFRVNDVLKLDDGEELRYGRTRADELCDEIWRGWFLFDGLIFDVNPVLK